MSLFETPTYVRCKATARGWLAAQPWYTSAARVTAEVRAIHPASALGKTMTAVQLDNHCLLAVEQVTPDAVLFYASSWYLYTYNKGAKVLSQDEYLDALEPEPEEEGE